MVSLKQMLRDFSTGHESLANLISRIEIESINEGGIADAFFEDVELALTEKWIDADTSQRLKNSILNAISTHALQTIKINTPAANTGTNVPSPIGAVDTVTISTGATLRGRYLIEEVLGKGGMGTVYKAVDLIKRNARDPNPHVAVKILNDDLLQTAIADLALQREASRQQRLAHPNIATVYDFDRIDNLAFITMEYLEGTPLDQFIKNVWRNSGGLAALDGISIIKALGGALTYAHAHHFVHADFKPGNCFVTRNGVAKVLDFGIARVIRPPNTEGATLLDGGTLGAYTPAYASLELIIGSDDPDPSDDVYSLACVSYEILSGKHPFGRVPANVANQQGLRYRNLRNLTRSQNRALRKALAFHRTSRTSNVDAFLHELTAAPRSVGAVKNTTVAAAGIAIAGGLYWVHSRYVVIQDQRIQFDLQSGNQSRMRPALQQLKSIEPDRKLKIIAAASTALVDFYSGEISRLTNKENFTDAEKTVEEARGLFPDSARIEAAAQREAVRKSRLLGALGESFENALREGNLLSGGRVDSLPVVLSRIKNLDPKSGLLSDARIVRSYADATRAAIDRGHLDEAETLLTVGRGIDSESSILINAQDLLYSAKSRADARIKFDSLVSRLRRLTTRDTTLAELVSALADVTRLKGLDTHNSLIAVLASNAEEKVREDLHRLELAPKLTDISSYYDKFSPLMGTLELDDSLAKLKNLRSSTESRYRTLVESLSKELGSDAVSNHLSDLDRDLRILKTIAPDDPSTTLIEANIVSEIENRAGLLIDQHDWPKAKSSTLELANFSLSQDNKERITQLQIKIDAAEREFGDTTRIQDQALADAEKAHQAERLVADISNELGKLKTSVELRSLASKTARLQVLKPNSTEVEDLRAKIADRAAELVLDVGKSPDRLSVANDQVAEALVLFPRSEVLKNASRIIREKIATQKAVNLAQQAQHARTEFENMSSSIPSPLTTDWTNAVSKAIATMRSIDTDDKAVVAATVEDFASRLVSEAKRLRETKRFDLAAKVLTYARTITPTYIPLLNEAKILVSDERTFESERMELERTARVEAQKQTFFAFSSGAEPEKAVSIFASLSDTLSPTDRFVQKDGPSALAKSYLQASKSAFSRHRYDESLTLARQGIKYLPNDEALKTWITKLTSTTNTERPAAAISNSSSQDLVASTQIDNSRPTRSTPETSGSQSRFDDRTKAAPAVDSKADHEAGENSASTLPKESDRLISQKENSPKIKSTSDLFGTWCGEKAKISFDSSSVVFSLADGNVVSYRAGGYSFVGQNISVNWSDSEGNSITSEFGEFSTSGNEMRQLRGKTSSSDWVTYNRPFSRCK